jgi:hypothetical protein
MRFALTGLAVMAVAALTGSAHDASQAQFNKRYCTFGGSDDSGGGLPDCSFNTWEQCRMTASGLARYCGENPHWKPDGNEERTKRGKKSRG